MEHFCKFYTSNVTLHIGLMQAFYGIPKPVIKSRTKCLYFERNILLFLSLFLSLSFFVVVVVFCRRRRRCCCCCCCCCRRRRRRRCCCCCYRRCCHRSPSLLDNAGPRVPDCNVRDSSTVSIMHKICP